MLDVKNLTVTFNDDHPAEAVRGINLHMEDGETLGLVGESGSGKTVTAMTIAGLLEKVARLNVGNDIARGIAVSRPAADVVPERLL